MITAQHETECAVCGHPIRVGSRIALRKGAWIHPGCAPGGDDDA